MGGDGAANEKDDDWGRTAADLAAAPLLLSGGRGGASTAAEQSSSAAHAVCRGRRQTLRRTARGGWGPAGPAPCMRITDLLHSTQNSEQAARPQL